MPFVPARCHPVGDLDCLRVRCADRLSLRPGLPLLALKGAGDRNGDRERRQEWNGREECRHIESWAPCVVSLCATTAVLAAASERSKRLQAV